MAVLVSATVILLTDWYAADAIASLVIAAMIVPRAISLLREVAEVLLESTPRDVDLDELREHILAMDGVKDVHDLHVWTITSGMPVMSAHVVVEDSVTAMDDAHGVLDRLRGCLADHFDVEHSTFQIEPAGHVDSEQPRPSLGRAREMSTSRWQVSHTSLTSGIRVVPVLGPLARGPVDLY